MKFNNVISTYFISLWQILKNSFSSGTFSQYMANSEEFFFDWNFFTIYGTLCTCVHV